MSDWTPTADEVRALAHPEADLPGDDQELALHIADAVVDVGLALGRDGRLYADTAALDDAQVLALKRATTRGVEHRLEQDVSELTGAGNYIGGSIRLAYGAHPPPSPAVLRELAGFDLIRRSLVGRPRP